MLELIQAGGILMWPLMICSIISMAIIAERFWSLRAGKIVPKDLVATVRRWHADGLVDAERLLALRRNSPLGRILATGLVNRGHSREIMKESIEEAGRHVAHELDRFLNTLGTIASITPLLGLLGTVIGMIKVFAVITSEGLGNPGVLAEGISEALITTATGLTIAIPSLMFYRFFRGRVDQLVVSMEQEALKLVAGMHNAGEGGA
ncbi:MAG: MotA/TolQ/ExbB proton channel family protein [Gammaproteobacteria bacterium]